MGQLQLEFDSGQNEKEFKLFSLSDIKSERKNIKY